MGLRLPEPDESGVIRFADGSRIESGFVMVEVGNHRHFWFAKPNAGTIDNDEIFQTVHSTPERAAHALASIGQGPVSMPEDHHISDRLALAEEMLHSIVDPSAHRYSDDAIRMFLSHPLEPASMEPDWRKLLENLVLTMPEYDMAGQCVCGLWKPKHLKDCPYVAACRALGREM
jgi:hypothetical protein